MASTPTLETRSPLTILNNLPKEHEKAIKQAFYNTAANIFILLACATTVAVYFILESFLKPLLWAVLCGAFLYPFKRTVTSALKRWLANLRGSETPFVVGLAITPIKCADSAIDYVCNTVFLKIKLVVGICFGIPAAYILWHFGPIWTIFTIVKGVFVWTYDLLGYFSSFWIWTLFIAYTLAIVFVWGPGTRDTLKLLSVPVWLMVILHVAATAGVLRVPLLLLMGTGIVIGFAADRNEIHKRQTEGEERSRKSVFESALTFIIGQSSTNTEESPVQEATEPSEADSKTAEVETIGKPVKSQDTQPADKPVSEVTKPSSLNVNPEVLRRPIKRSKLVLTPVEAAPATKSLSDQCFIGLLWGLVLTRVWLHFWLVCALLPIPLAVWTLKKLGLTLSSPEGPLGDRVKVIRQGLADWIRDRKDVIMPHWLRGIARLVMKGDQKIILVLESSLDKATSVMFILLLLIGSSVGALVFAVQVQQESMYLVKTSSNLLNNTLHPELASWLPNNEDFQQAMDSLVGNAYSYGRSFIATKVRDMVSSDPKNPNVQVEEQVLDVWDRLYESWLARNASSTSLATKGPAIDITNLSSIWNVVTQGDGFNFSDIIAFVKENIGTFVSVLESIWLVVKGNMNLVITILTSVLSLVFGGGTALLNFVLSSVIFLTTLFYLLASSGDQYKPIEWFAAMSPGSGGNTFGQAVQDAVSGVFMASLKMAVFYGLYTWLTHSLFGVNIVFIPSALAAVFGAVPFVGTYLAAIPAVLELWLVQDKSVLAILLLVIHFLPSYVVDTAIYSEIKGGHPYMTGLAIAGGMMWLGLEGAIFGPIILCCLIVLANVYSTMIKPDSPQFVRPHTIR